MSAPLEPHIASRILLLREQRVMLDADLATLYGVETRVLVQAIKRNAARFPADFMFQLSAEEFANLRSQFVISSSGTGASTSAKTSPGYGGRRYAPYAFTEQGVAMLSTVLSSERAVVINIEIMRTFVKVRTLASTHQDLAKQLAELQDKTESLAMSHDTFSRNTRAQLRQVFDALRELTTPPEQPKRPIGFVTHEDKKDSPSKPAGKRSSTQAKAAGKKT